MLRCKVCARFVFRHHECCPQLSPFAALSLFCSRIVCFIYGHDLHDDGFAGPDSGCIDINCHRCGAGEGRRWLY